MIAALRKLRGKWLAEVRYKGFYKSKTFHTKVEAQCWVKVYFKCFLEVKRNWLLGQLFLNHHYEIHP